MGKVPRVSLKINRLKLNDELTRQAATFASAAEAAELLHDELAKLKLKIEFLADQFTDDIRRKYRNVNPKTRPTETAIKAMLGSMQEMKDLKEQYRSVSHAYRMAKIQVEALKMRADMIVTLANNVRAEKKQSESKGKV